MSQWNQILAILAFTLLVTVSSASVLSDITILSAVRDVSKYSLNTFNKMQAPAAFETYVDSIPRNISQVDITSFTNAFSAQLGSRVTLLEDEVHKMIKSYAEACTPEPSGTTPLKHFGISVYDAAAVYGPAADDYKTRAMCSLNAVPKMPSVTLPLISENDHTSWALADNAADTDLTWTANEPKAPMMQLDKAVLWHRMMDARTGSIAVAPAPIHTGGFHDARESAAFINGASAVIHRAAAVVLDPFVNNDYTMGDLPRLYSNMFHLARTVLMSLGDADGMTIHSTDGRYVGDNTFLATADAQHDAITRGLHPAVWYRRMDMVKNLHSYFTTIATDGYSTTASGLMLGESGKLYSRDLFAAITRAVDSLKHSVSTDESTPTRFVLKPEAPAYLYILTTVPQVDTTFGYDLRKLLLDCGVGIIPVFIDVRSTLPAQTKSPWETVKGYFATTDSQWNRALCDINAHTVTPDLMYDFQVDPFIDTAVEYTKRAAEYLQYTVSTKARVLPASHVVYPALFDVLVELVISASETAHRLHPTKSQIRIEMAMDELTGRQVVQLVSPVFVDGELDAVATIDVDILTFIFFLDLSDVKVSGYPFNAHASIYDMGGRLFFNSMLSSARLTDQDSLDLLDPEEIEGWVDGGFMDALWTAVGGQYTSHTVNVKRQTTGISTTTVLTRYVFAPIGALLLVTSWPEHYHTRVNLRPDLLTMDWCPETFAGEMNTFLGTLSGVACYDPQVYARTSTIAARTDDAADYQAMMGLDANMFGTTYASILPRYNTLKPGWVGTLEDVDWDDLAAFIDYNNKTAHATPERRLDWIMTDRAVGEMQVVSILSAAWRYAFAADPTLTDRVKYINAITIDDAYTYGPNIDFLAVEGAVSNYGTSIKHPYFFGPFESDQLGYTDPYPNAGGTLVNVGLRVHLNDRGYARPWIAASLDMSLDIASQDIVDMSPCGNTVSENGESYYLDCFLLTNTAHLTMMNDVDRLQDELQLSETGIITLEDKYPAMFDFLTRNGVYKKRSTIDFNTLQRVEFFEMATDFGEKVKLIIDQELVAATCVVGTQMPSDQFKIVQLHDPTKLNREIAACRLPGHNSLFVMAQNVTISPDRFASQTFVADEVALTTSPIFKSELERLSPEFGDSVPSTVDIGILHSNWAIKKDGSCSLMRRTAPAELVGSLLIVSGTTIGLFGCCAWRVVTIMLRFRRRRCNNRI